MSGEMSGLAICARSIAGRQRPSGHYAWWVNADCRAPRDADGSGKGYSVRWIRWLGGDELTPAGYGLGNETLVGVSWKSFRPQTAPGVMIQSVAEIDRSPTRASKAPTTNSTVSA